MESHTPAHNPLNTTSIEWKARRMIPFHPLTTTLTPTSDLLLNWGDCIHRSQCYDIYQVLFVSRSYSICYFYDHLRHIDLLPFGKLMSRYCTLVTFFDAGCSRSTQTRGLAVRPPQCCLSSRSLRFVPYLIYAYTTHLP